MFLRGTHSPPSPEPHRRRILDRLRDGECAVGDLVDLLQLSQPGASKHLRILREARLVAVRADGKRRVPTGSRPGR